MAARLRFLPGADVSIEEALTHTLRTFGEAKYVEYTILIEAALEALVENPFAGMLYPEIDAEARGYRIAQPGKPARHMLLYRVLESGELVEVFGLPYDGMDLLRFWGGRR